MDVPPFSIFNLGATFDGATYLSRGAGLTGAADSKQFTISFWYMVESNSAGNHIIIQGSTGGVGLCEVGVTFEGIPYLVLLTPAVSYACFIYGLSTLPN